jgi:hypothetical protein
MSFLKSHVATTKWPDGYQPDLDRKPPSEARGCGRIIILMVIGIAVLAGTGFVLMNSVFAGAANVSPTPTPSPFVETLLPTASPTPSPTLDPWALTGTASFLATVTPTTDYCWFLTPSPTPTATPEFIPTPDAWALEGTRIYLATGTPTMTAYPTQPPPRAWCDLPATATLTPLPLDGIPTTDPSLLMPTLIPTTTLFPTFPARQDPAPAPVVNPPAANPAPVVNPPAPAPPEPITVIITATPRPTNTATASPTMTATASPSPTASPTASSTPTATATSSSTPTATASPTLSPTAQPLLVVYQSTCAAGYPIFAVGNFGGGLQPTVWSIELAGTGIVASGQIELTLGGYVFLDARAWAGYAGLYVLRIAQPWDAFVPELAAQIACLASPTPQLTLTETTIITPIPVTTYPIETATAEATYAP